MPRRRKTNVARRTLTYPREVLIRGYRYTIDFVDTPREVDRELTSVDYIGQCYGGNPGRIRVLGVQQPIGTLDSVIHEILHVILARNSTLRASIRPEIGEEPFVDTLATELADLIIANGWLKLPTTVKATMKRISHEGT